MKRRKGIPPELHEAHRLQQHGIPLASSWEGFQNVPARLVQDTEILMAGRQDADEWQALKLKQAGNR